MSAFSSSDIEEIARLLLESGRDRIPHVPDRRRIPSLRSRGLLQYPDGYSLTAEAMQGAVRTWRIVAQEAARHRNQERAAELTVLVQKGTEWVQKHNVTPDTQKLRFSDLPFAAYHALWEVVTNRGREVREVLRKADLEPLLKKGYLQDDRVPGWVVPTAKGTQLVQEYGNPFLGLGMAAKVAARYLLSK